jgi:hypothetical protein
VKKRGFLVAVARIAAMMLAASIVGCATLVPSDEMVVEQRAMARWKAIIANDLREAYEFISPAGRSLVPFEAYQSSIKRGFHKAARVLEVKCSSSDLCEVSLELEYEYSRRRIKTPLQEKWVRQDSQWWFLYQR